MPISKTWKCRSIFIRGDSYSMTVTVESNYETDAKLQLLQGTEMVSQTSVHLNEAGQPFCFETEGSRYR